MEKREKKYYLPVNFLNARIPIPIIRIAPKTGAATGRISPIASVAPVATEPKAVTRAVLTSAKLKPPF